VRVTIIVDTEEQSVEVSRSAEESFSVAEPASVRRAQIERLLNLAVVDVRAACQIPVRA
jgi:hypothetical protein